MPDCQLPRFSFEVQRPTTRRQASAGYDLVGVMAGALLAGAVANILRRRKVMLFSCVWFSVGMAFSAKLRRHLANSGGLSTDSHDRAQELTLGRIKIATLAISVLAIVGCATTASHDTIAVSGRIAETFDAAATTASQGIYRPGMGGALGGVIAGLITAARTEPAHTIYVLALSDGTKRYVRDRAQIKVGTCVAVLTESSRLGQESWMYGEASLQGSNKCTE
jgi:MFS family permease